MAPSFHEEFVGLFDAHHGSLYRYLVRLSGEPELAADLAQEAFVRLYRRGAVPDAPGAWLVTVAMNLFRNARTQRARRLRLLTPARGEGVLSEAPRSPLAEAGAAEMRGRVRDALERLGERERQLLLLRAEGHRYRDIAAALGLNEASVGTLLARARRAFLQAYHEGTHAP